MSKVSYKEVKLPDYDHVPRWLLLTGEIDLRYFLLEQTGIEWSKRDGLTQMIDKATGYDKKMEADVIELMNEINWLRREYDNCDIKPQSEEGEKG